MSLRESENNVVKPKRIIRNTVGEWSDSSSTITDEAMRAGVGIGVSDLVKHDK